MAIKVKRKHWDDETFRNAVLNVAELLQEDVEIVYPKRVKLYNVQVWKDDNIIFEHNFTKRSQAMKYIKKVLHMRKCKGAYADLKKYSNNTDDFSWWYYKLENNKIVETFNI